MEAVTWITGGILLTILGGLGGRLWSDTGKVSTSLCELRHNSMEKLVNAIQLHSDTKFEAMKLDLDRIEEKIDKINNRNNP
jgi:hypothetical protein